jgi:dienelactone hydrolase
VVKPEMMSPDYKGEPFDLMAFIGKHSKEKSFVEVEACVKALRSEHGFKKIGAIGFCYGGYAMFRLASKELKAIDCMSTGHPAQFDKGDIEALGGCPVQLLAPEEDFTFTPELKEHCLKVLPTVGIDWDYQYFHGVKHGFCTRGDQNDKVQKQALERAKNAAVAWFGQYLH